MIVIKIKYLNLRSGSINLLMIIIKLIGLNMQESSKPINQMDSAKSISKGRGRPKCFNEEQALEKAMTLFWKYGYEATSMSDLTFAMGITAPSLYSTYGDKSELFNRCIDYYLKHESCSMEMIFKHVHSIKLAMELYLIENLKRLVQKDKPKGCMLVVSTMNCSIQNQQIQQSISQKRQLSKSNLLEKLLAAQASGEISTQANIQAMTDYYMTILQGLSLQARDGATFEQLESVVHMAMQTWDHF